MTSKEAMKYQLKNLKGKPLKQKLEHIISYYWVHILVTLLVLTFFVSQIIHIATMKDVAINAVCINAWVDYEKSQAYMESFAESSGIDLKEYTVQLSADLTISDTDSRESYQSAQLLAAQTAAQLVDVLAADIETLNWCFYQSILTDLREVLTPEQQEKFAPFYLYMDLAVLEQMREDIESAPKFPDPTKPEMMEKPVPVALRLPEGGDFTTLCYSHAASHAAVAIVSSTKNLNHCLTFLDYIME